MGERPAPGRLAETFGQQRREDEEEREVEPGERFAAGDCLPVAAQPQDDAAGQHGGRRPAEEPRGGVLQQAEGEGEEGGAGEGEDPEEGEAVELLVGEGCEESRQAGPSEILSMLQGEDTEMGDLPEEKESGGQYDPSYNFV